MINFKLAMYLCTMNDSGMSLIFSIALFMLGLNSYIFIPVYPMSYLLTVFYMQKNDSGMSLTCSIASFMLWLNSFVCIPVYPMSINGRLSN